jgi:hypothetical protein
VSHLNNEIEVLKEKMKAEGNLLRKKLESETKLRHAQNFALNAEMLAKTAEAERRTAERFLMLGFSREYELYQQKFTSGPMVTHAI